MSTKTGAVVIGLNGKKDHKIIKHEQFKDYLMATFTIGEVSAEILDKALIKLVQTEHDVNRLTREKEAYEAKPLCSGTAHWPADNVGYMKCNHGVGVKCPLHGSPKTPRGRLRVGVGRDRLKIQMVTQAIEDYHAWEHVAHQLSVKESDLRRLQKKLLEAIGIYRW